MSSTWYHPGFQDFQGWSYPDIWFLPSFTPTWVARAHLRNPVSARPSSTLRVFCACYKTLEQIIEYYCHVALRRICATTWAYFLYRNPCLVCVPLRYPTDTFLHLACNPPPLRTIYVSLLQKLMTVQRVCMVSAGPRGESYRQWIKLNLSSG